MHKLAILAFDGLPMFELGCALEVFALPRPEFSNWYQVQVVSFEKGSVRTSTNLMLEVQQVQDLDDFDTLIIPGWDTDSKKVKMQLAEQIVNFAQKGKRVISLCSGAFLLAQLGLLNGKQATTHWRYSDKFQQRFSQVEYVDNVLYTQEGNVACSAGSAAGLDLCVELVRQDFGHQAANSVARRLVISPHRSGGQAQYVETPVPATHSSFSDTLDWALARLNKPLVVDDLAKQANMSRRSFDRHFRASLGLSPKAWLNQQRVQLAKQVLESESINIEKLAMKVGFDNAITLRFNFNKYVGISPSQYQSQFGQSANC